METRSRIVYADPKGRVCIGIEHARGTFELDSNGADVILRPVEPPKQPEYPSGLGATPLANPSRGVKRGRPSRYDVDLSEEL